ncbi:ethanolamine utilization protein EutJ [Bradyrhizobium sp. Ec3.3]|uniref:ethanolamine utilization protein EutJ n=1 Tax=Bradyrhizobium sp. Ec3.3 TaxID=189753 RepID=UPI0004816FC4
MLARTRSPKSTVSQEVTAFLETAAATFRSSTCSSELPLSFGVDLGTATIVLTAVDGQGRPVYWDCLPCQAVRDGVVVNFADAVTAVRQLKATATCVLEREIAAAATAFPPGVPQAEARACRYVLENAGITCRQLVDEVTAAQALLRLHDGVIVDVGGGSTGVGVVSNGIIIALDDEPGGGHHLDLILAGALRIPVEEAEERKRRGDQDYSHILRPGIERIASSIVRQIRNHAVESIHLVGGAVRVSHAAAIVAGFSGIQTWAYPHSELVTPFGIAMS